MATSNKLSVSDVIDIRRAMTLGATTAQLASTFNVTQRTIQRVLNGQIWASVPADQPLKNFNNKYELTADGRVWSVSKGAYIETATNGNVRLTVDGRKVTVNVSQLVENTFN